MLSRLLFNAKEIKMSWEIIEGNWTLFRENVKVEWDVLSEGHLDTVAGKRDHLISIIQENYGVSQREAESQVKDWEERNQDLFAETAAAIRKLPKSLHGATE
jgi:uncharacterized protein YjbJ (UPF0337 family)